MSRPTKYTPALGGIICERMSEGLSLKTICKDETMPLARTVYEWIEGIQQFRHNYARATNERGAAIFEESLDIADDGSNDWMVREGKDGATGWALNGEHVNRSRLRVETRKWFLSRMDPKKYGDKQHVEHSGDINLGLADRLEKARKRAD